MYKFNYYLLGVVSYFLCFSIGYASLDIELTQGVHRALPIAVLPFDASTPQEQTIDAIIGNNLQNSGRFSLIEGTALTDEIDYAYWLNQGANYLVVGRVQPLEDSRQLVSVRLVDPVGQQQLLLNHQFRVQPSNMRQLAHHISDLIYEQLMGEQGIFSTRIAYINAQHDTNRYVLEVADFDGVNPKPLLTSSEPIMSPVWSPNGKEIAYVTFENKQAEIHIVNVATGERRPITQYSGINGAPAWSPDGNKLAVVLSKEGSPSIYQMELANNQLTRLTHGDSIDTEPNWSPDGQSILFTSDRGGSPQIYRLNLDDNTVERVTFSGNYNARASYTPDGRDIVLLHQTRNGQFNIATQDIQHGVINVLTKTGGNESPSLAPNGKMIIYATREQGQGALRITSLDGQVQLRLPTSHGDVQEPAWSPLLHSSTPTS